MGWLRVFECLYGRQCGQAMRAGIGGAFVIGVPDFPDAVAAGWAIEFESSRMAQGGAAAGAERVWTFAVGEQRWKLGTTAVARFEIGMKKIFEW